MTRVCLYITSLEKWSGKTVVALAIAHVLKQRGMRVCVFKPVSVATARLDDRPADPTVLTLKQVLKLDEDISTLNPVVVDSVHRYPEDMMRMRREDIEAKILEAWNRIRSKYDAVIVIGYKSCTHMFLGKILELEIAKMLNCPILAVVKPTSEDVLGDIAYLRALCSQYGVKLVGVVLNRVKHYLLHQAQQDWSQILGGIGIDVVGVIPEIPELQNPSLRDIVQELGGTVLTGHDMLDVTFEHILVGAMTPEVAARYMRSVPNKIVITGGDRADLIMLALETDTRAVILTGGVYPSTRVIAKAEEKKIPLILVPYDTYTTLNKILSISGKLRPGDKRLDIVTEQVVRYLSVDRIIEKASIS